MWVSWRTPRLLSCPRLSWALGAGRSRSGCRTSASTPTWAKSGRCGTSSRDRQRRASSSRCRAALPATLEGRRATSLRSPTLRRQLRRRSSRMFRVRRRRDPCGSPRRCRRRELVRRPNTTWRRGARASAKSSWGAWGMRGSAALMPSLSSPVASVGGRPCYGPRPAPSSVSRPRRLPERCVAWRAGGSHRVLAAARPCFVTRRSHQMWFSPRTGPFDSTWRSFSPGKSSLA
mmetsp:Transcript_69733/g.202349  ORF Transcript_69733/g.202349 Transcript_69733/m.202349 type:complete len:232 (+) Transcript_69733:392-1087(+)